MMENNKNEITRRENETEKPGEHFFYQDPQRRDPFFHLSYSAGPEASA